jgi:transcriptional antiterminator NusG
MTEEHKMSEEQMAPKSPKAAEDPEVPVDQDESEERKIPDNHKWYVVHTTSGREMKAKEALEKKIESNQKQECFSEVLVPSESIIEMVKGAQGKKEPKERKSKRKFFPGYILVQMNLNDETFHLVKETPHITGFVGGGIRNPPAVPQAEIDRIKTQVNEGTLKPRPRVMFERGDHVRVIQGPFANFNGTVDEVNPEKAKLTVMVSIFGRSTPVELEFLQVEKQ